MDDVLAVDERPDDPTCPVVCREETSRQALGDTRSPKPAVPGRSARHDPKYVRSGVATRFSVTEPLRGWRHVPVGQPRTGIAFARGVRDLVKVHSHYPTAERSVAERAGARPAHPHSLASLSAAVPPHEARRLTEHLEIHSTHSTPRHGSWPNLAEPGRAGRERAGRQCLSQRLPDRETIARAVAG